MLNSGEGPWNRNVQLLQLLQTHLSFPVSLSVASCFFRTSSNLFQPTPCRQRPPLPTKLKNLALSRRFRPKILRPLLLSQYACNNTRDTERFTNFRAAKPQQMRTYFAFVPTGFNRISCS